MPGVPTHSPETIERARSLYREGARVRDICAATGLSVGALYYHLDGFSLPGSAVQRLPRRRDVSGDAQAPLPMRGRRKLAARLWRAAERQARKIEFSLSWEHQRREDRAQDLLALKELARILKDLAAFEDAPSRAGPRGRGGDTLEHEEAVAVEGRAVVFSRTRRT